MSGALNRDGQAIVLEGEIRAIALIALWVRSVVPAQQPLILYDEGYNADIEIRVGATVDELIAPFL